MIHDDWGQARRFEVFWAKAPWNSGVGTIRPHQTSDYSARVDSICANSNSSALFQVASLKSAAESNLYANSLGRAQRVDVHYLPRNLLQKSRLSFEALCEGEDRVRAAKDLWRTTRKPDMTFSVRSPLSSFIYRPWRVVVQSGFSQTCITTFCNHAKKLGLRGAAFNLKAT